MIASVASANQSIPVIVGSGRSGTTWVQDVLARSNNYRTSFEPLHPVAVPAMSHYACKYLRVGDRSEALEKYLYNIFHGSVSGIWDRYRVRPDRLSPSLAMLLQPRKLYEYLRRIRKLFKHFLRYRKDKNRPILTKFIRANLMVNWMEERMNARILFVVRHPAAVIESKMRLGGDDWDPDTSIKRYTEQKALYEDCLSQYQTLFEKSYSAAGKHAIIWCIENQFISELNANKNIQVCYYEDLISQPDSEWSSVCRFFDFKNTPESSVRSKASQQARPERVNTGYSTDQLISWRNKFTEAELNEIQEVLDSFGINCYSIDEAGPVRLDGDR